MIRRFNKGYRFILCGNGIYGKYVCVLLLEDKKGITIIKDFQKNLNESNGKPNIVWVDKSSKSYKRLMKSWLQDNDIGMYSAHNKWKFVVAEIFIGTLKN